jgi:hypothetical protein
LITRYEDVTALLKDERFVKNRRTAMSSEQLRKMPRVPPMFRPLEVPLVAGPRRPAAQPVGISLTELKAPFSDSLIAEGDSAHS